MLRLDFSIRVLVIFNRHFRKCSKRLDFSESAAKVLWKKKKGFLREKEREREKGFKKARERERDDRFLVEWGV